jgi:hypothetical protein
VLACVTTGGANGLRAEVWSAGRDGASSPQRIAELGGGISSCRAIVADGSHAYLLAAGEAGDPQLLLHVDLAMVAGAPNTVFRADRFTGIAMDDAAAFVIADGAIVRIERGNGAQRVLVDADGRRRRAENGAGTVGSLVDRRLTVAGGFLYWFGSHGT